MVSQNSALIVRLSAILILSSLGLNGAVFAKEIKEKKSPFSDFILSPNLTGSLGLNTIPSARMDSPGTLRAGVSTLDPYLNTYITAQVARPLSLTFRQTSEISSLTEDAIKLYPGVDLKLRLMEENAYRPAMALGVQSAIGHRKMAGEYLAFSKRYNNMDFTAGLGWGRYGTAGHFKNPLNALSSHFDKNRDFNSEAPNKPSNWFTGEDVGVFGGVEYFLPYDGFSVKMDYGADRYVAEKAVSDYKSAAPWSIGLAYNHQSWLSAGIGLQGTDKVMGRISLQGSPATWPLRASRYSEHPRPIYSNRPAQTDIPRMIYEARKEGINLSDIWTNEEETHLLATLYLPENVPAPKHVGRATRHIAANAQSSIEKITITLKRKALHGTRISIMRSDIEKAFKDNNSSANEMWQNATFNNDYSVKAMLIASDDFEEITAIHEDSPFLPLKKFSMANSFAESQIPPLKQATKPLDIRLIFDNQIGLSEEDSGFLRRSSLIIEGTSSPFLGFINGVALRLNLSDNLDNISKLRPKSTIPVHSDIDDFTDQLVGLDRVHSSYMHSLTPELHAAASIGYLEEFYAGFGGQLLYRPIHSRLAVGGEAWQAYRRDPDTTLNLGLNGTQVTTGHAHLWYDVPCYDITAQISVGRYLLGDNGFSAGLEKHFNNGASLSASTTLTNASDADLFDGTTHSYHSLNLSLPLGSLPYIPSGSEMRLRNTPFGRDSAQILDKPLDLYSLTQSFTVDDIARHWPEIAE